MLSALIACLILPKTPQEATGINLLTNADLSSGFAGWQPIWSRKEGSATATLAPGKTPNSQAIQVKQTDTQDWAVAQDRHLPVKPREIYELSAWMKTEGGSGNISVVARDGNNQTLNWELGPVGPTKPGWQYVHRLLMIPKECQTIQFRIVGYGAGQTWVQSPSLAKAAFKPTPHAPQVTLQNPSLSLTLKEDGAIIATTKQGKTWAYREWPEGIITQSLEKPDPQTAVIKVLDLSNSLATTLTLKLDKTAPEAKAAIQAEGPLQENLSIPGSLKTRHGQWLVLPLNEGLRLPVEDKTIDGWSLITYGGHGLCMPWTGVIDPSTGAGAMTILETPDDADVQFTRQDDCLTFQPRWEPSKGAFAYTRKLRLTYFNQGGFVAMAKRYRTYAKATGLFKTLADKRKENPNVDRLIGAVNVWTWEPNKVEICQEMKQMGFDHVLWSGDGNAEQIKAIAALGYLPGRYDIYQDVWDPKHSLSWQNTEGWPDDLVLEPNGDWMKGWAHPDKHPDGSITWYQGGVISSGPGLARAKRKIPADLAKVPYMARFLDTTTASPFREDYNPLHPLTRSQDRANKMALLEFCSKDEKLVVGTETGIDPSVPVVEYYEGMMSLGPFRLPDAGTFMMEYRKPTPDFLKFQVGSMYRIPLWELVYHDCTVAQWYWGDATNKAPEVWDQRDLLNILYGTAPLLMFDKERWNRDKARMLQTYQNVCRWTRKIGYDEMLSHQDLAPDHSVQRTTWSSGRSVIVNFSDQTYKNIPPKSFRISEKT